MGKHMVGFRRVRVLQCGGVVGLVSSVLVIGASGAIAQPLRRTLQQEAPTAPVVAPNPNLPETLPDALPNRVPPSNARPSLQLPPPQTPPSVPLAPRSPSTDPAEQIAPAVIELNNRQQAISSVMALAMERELQQLIGRFESALLMANSQGLPTEVTLAGTAASLTASLEGANVPESVTHPALVDAHQLLLDWPDLMSQREYATARERWQSARQALWDNFPQDRTFAQAEVRAIWIDRGTIIQARNRQGLERLFDRLAEAGFNTVFFETVNAGFTIYPSRVAPMQNPLTGRWDPLAEAVALAHERNMDIHAWIWTFAAGNQRHNTILNLPADYPGPMLALNPDWAGSDNRGNWIPIGQDKPFYDPANANVRAFLLRLVSEIITTYDVDGLQLDYIRYPFQDPGANRTYGYGQEARWRFRSMMGVDPIDLTPRPDLSASQAEQQRQRILWDRWTEFRIQQVNSFVESVAQMVRRQRPDIVLSAAVFAKPEHERLQKIQQDWGTWVEDGYVDWIVLMSYAADTPRFEQLVEPWLVDTNPGKTLIIPSIRLLNLTQPAIMDQLQMARDLPTPGYALFAAADLNASLESMLSRTQGRTGLDALPQHEPYQVALSRYQSLQREWNWLLSNRRLWMEQPKLIAWVEAVNQLEQDLIALTEDPTGRRLQAVRARLEEVRTPLLGQALVDSGNSTYRLETWNNRLTTIEQLLTYGEARTSRRR